MTLCHSVPIHSPILYHQLPFLIPTPHLTSLLSRPTPLSFSSTSLLSPSMPFPFQPHTLTSIFGLSYTFTSTFHHLPLTLFIPFTSQSPARPSSHLPRNLASLPHPSLSLPPLLPAHLSPPSFVPPPPSPPPFSPRNSQDDARDGPSAYCVHRLANILKACNAYKAVHRHFCAIKIITTFGEKIRSSKCLQGHWLDPFKLSNIQAKVENWLAEQVII